MLIPHPLLGPRDAQEFTYLGDARLIARPDGMAEGAEAHQHMERVLEQFEEFCVVTQSVRQGIEVDVIVRDHDGRVLKGDKSFEAGA